MILTHPERLYIPSGDCYLEANFRLAEMTTYRVGGPAQWFIAPHSLDQLQASVQWASSEGLPITVLGAGSNLLISDRGLPGLVISTRHLRDQTFCEETQTITVAAGKPLPRLCWQLAKQGWAGLEWAVGIPGTIGGAVVMNAGAHGESISDSLVEAIVLEPDGTQRKRSNAELEYSYRSSTLQGGQSIVLSATFSLQQGQSAEAVQATTESHLNHRLGTQPYDLPSCGSVFRNPLPKTAGWLIENSGLKGFTIGGAQVALKHANFIVNLGNATASDIYALIFHIQTQIENRWALKLRPEVKILGNFDRAA
ncbi:UDP-N-acetylmuramate dehydrogenase [Altericista sp. CCNU0014]|uniref:UDP-N-acetylmuramate dehydrogenase n=1 Tax=Altericista sp. CCNU0014 TaxID=3082949 RepID=UPI0038514AE8